MIFLKDQKPTVSDQVIEILSDAVGILVAKSICKSTLAHFGLTSERLNRHGLDARLVDKLEQRLQLFCKDTKKVSHIHYRLQGLNFNHDNTKTAPVDSTSTLGQLHSILSETVGAHMARIVCQSALARAGLNSKTVERHGINEALIGEIEQSCRNCCRDERKVSRTVVKLREIGPSKDGPISDSSSCTVEINLEVDIVIARNKAHSLAQSLGFDHVSQIKISTAVSELGRNIFNYAGKGTIRMTRLADDRNGLRIVAKDEGPGIANLDDILAGRFTSKTGLGLGIVGCKKLMNEFSIQSEVGKGTKITMAKYL